MLEADVFTFQNFLKQVGYQRKKIAIAKKEEKKRKEKEDIDGKFLLKTVVLKYFSKHVCKLQITLPDPGNRNNSHSPRYIQKKFSRAKLPPPLDPEKSKNISPRCMCVWGSGGDVFDHATYAKNYKRFLIGFYQRHHLKVSLRVSNTVNTKNKFKEKYFGK